jgi:hypothetical protein
LAYSKSSSLSFIPHCIPLHLLTTFSITSPRTKNE